MAQIEGNSPFVFATRFAMIWVNRTNETAMALQAEGIEMFYLGGAREQEEGLRAYKSGFGTTPIETDAVTAYVGGRLRRGISAVVESIQGAGKPGT